MATNFLTKIFGSRNDRLLKTYRKTVERINALEPEIAALNADAALDDAAKQARVEDRGKDQQADRILAERGPAAFTILTADFDVVVAHRPDRAAHGDRDPLRLLRLAGQPLQAGLRAAREIFVVNEVVLEQLEAGGAGPDDVVMFFYSGHGDQVDVDRSARELDGRAETIELFDAAMTDGSALLTSLFHALSARGLWSETRGTNLLDGGAPFYATYACSDGGWLAVGAICFKIAEALHHM